MTYSRLVLAFCCFAAGVGAQQPELPPAPGRLVDVGRRRLHLLCSGQGAPTVVLEAGASAFAIDWTLVQREVARTHRVCSYDRAGMGWSDPSAASTVAGDVRNLHDLLRAAEERPPYVMVGASRGGLLVRAYVADYPEEVAGLVLVDPASEDRLFAMLNGQPALIASLTADQLRSTLPRQAMRLPRRRPQTGAPFDRLPSELYQLRIKLDERLIASIPDTVAPETIAVAQEAERAFLSRLLALRSATEHPLGDRPTVVLSRGDERNAGREAVHSALARLSTNSRHSVVAGAGHEIHLFEPGAVVQAISDVAQAVRSKTQLPVVRRPADTNAAAIQRELEALYQRNADAFQRHDLQAILALRAPDFHAIMPDGTIRDRAAMETYIRGFLNGVKRWNRQAFTIDSLRLAGDTAFAIVSQYLDRMALRPDNAVHHVETWVTQRETWVRTRGQWLMWRVDQLRNQRRVIDGRPG